MKSELAVLPLFAASFLLAQQIRPTTLPFEAVPPNTSPREIIAFTNTGTTPLTLAVTVSGPPFAIAENRCANGVKPGSHCNVYVTYAPATVGQVDNGTLAFNYGEGVVTAPLTGQGVSAIPTFAKMTSRSCRIINMPGGVGGISMTAKVWVFDKYYALPTGEQVHGTCTNGQEDVDLGSATLTICKGLGCPGGPYDQAPLAFSSDIPGKWTCWVSYDGNGVLGGGEVSPLHFEFVTSGGNCH